MTAVHATVSAMTLLAVAVSSAVRPVADELTEEEVVLAKAGIREFVVEHEVDPFDIADPCPIVSEETLANLLVDHGFSPNLTGWAPNLEWELGQSTVECGPAVDPDHPDPDLPHSAFAVAMELDTADLEFGDLVEDHGAALVAKDVALIDGEIAVVCGDEDVTFCIADWHRNGLMITLGLWGPVGDITPEATVDLLASFVPLAVSTLAGGSASNVHVR